MDVDLWTNVFINEDTQLQEESGDWSVCVRPLIMVSE